ncbi:hypothetical protein LUX33_42700 [Actinomadura madurae]|uniref:hypothetical protein n=1 Tax=Actinomadura madurae TaxID=1993 RepID=UPI0020D238EE|nr:hypothetical protein [Actinomadura madurae]MCP9954451.1 hypothetical protein [Actinomadura madurae]
MTAGDHAAEVDALARRFPGWTIWFGLCTGHWWALPPKDRDVGDFLEADTPQRLIARIEVVKHAAPRRRPPPVCRHPPTALRGRPATPGRTCGVPRTSSVSRASHRRRSAGYR